MGRVCVFCFHDDNGIVPRYVDYLLSELSSVSDHIVIVVNGKINERKVIEKYSEIVIERENLGFDACAYKAAFEDERVKTLIKNIDEIILCNDSFYGPLIPLNDIFREMEFRECDFWGLNYSISGLEHFIQSFFLVFKDKVTKNGALEHFFNNYNDSNINDFHNALIYFEREITHFLLERGYVSDAYVIQNHHLLQNVDGSIMADKLPVLKRKVFSDLYYEKNKMLNVLKWIKHNREYPIELILEDIKRRYDIVITVEEIESCNIFYNLYNSSDIKKTCINDVVRFIREAKGLVYIYGTGSVSNELMEILSRYDKKYYNVSGFIVSDDQKLGSTTFWGLPVLRYSEVINYNSQIHIVIALGKKNTQQVMKNISKDEDVLSLAISS